MFKSLMIKENKQLEFKTEKVVEKNVSFINSLEI